MSDGKHEVAFYSGWFSALAALNVLNHDCSASIDFFEESVDYDMKAGLPTSASSPLQIEIMEFNLDEDHVINQLATDLSYYPFVFLGDDVVANAKRVPDRGETELIHIAKRLKYTTGISRGFIKAISPNRVQRMEVQWCGGISIWKMTTSESSWILRMEYSD